MLKKQQNNLLITFFGFLLFAEVPLFYIDLNLNLLNCRILEKYAEIRRIGIPHVLSIPNPVYIRLWTTEHTQKN